MLFGLRLSAWAAVDKDLSETFSSRHELIAALLIALVDVHVLGGLKHLLIDEERVFQGVWF